MCVVLQELFPVNKRSYEYFSKYFSDAGLKELSDFSRNRQSIGARKELQKELQEQMALGVSFTEVREDASTRAAGVLPQNLCSEKIMISDLFLPDYIQLQGGDEAEQHLWAEDDRDHVDQHHELDGVE